mmetsp:Transcript_101424/g.316208  ORF Transcript_101424/g.316208 Transcript_101424/m.316208 type:complete len:453 (-) Transcript_101424:1057-2415(-)
MAWDWASGRGRSALGTVIAKAAALPRRPAGPPSSLDGHLLHELDVLLVLRPDLLRHDLACRRHAAVVWGPGLHHGHHGGDVEQRGPGLVLLGGGVELCLHSRHHLGVPAERLALLAGHPRLLRERCELFGLALRQGQRLVHLAVGIGADASSLGVDDVSKAVCRVHVLQRDVLPALELHKVLLTVHDLEVALGREHADVSRVEPAVGVEVLLRLLRLLEVAGRYAGPPDPDLAAPPARLAVGVLRVGGEVRLLLAVGDIRLGVQRKLHRGERGAGDADRRVEGVLHAGGAAGLREAVPLHQGAAEARAHPLLHLAGDGATARQRELHLAADHVLELLEHEEIEHRRVAAALHGRLLHPEGHLEDEGRGLAALGDLGLCALLDRLPHLRHTCHEGGLERLEGADGVALLGAPEQGLGVSVADAVAHAVEERLRGQLQDVRERQVTDVGLPARL